MKLIHNIKLTVFEYSDSDIESINSTIKKLFPFDIEKFTSISTAQGFNERSITTFEVLITKTSLINQFLLNLFSNLSPSQKTKLLKEKESRFDDEMHFFIRLDKQDMINNIYTITDSGDCFHLRFSIAAFPKKREIGLDIIEQIFSPSK